METKLYFSRFFLAMVFTVATLLSGVVHRMPHSPLDESLANYLQAGLSLDDFCGDVPGSTFGSGFCEFCNLVGAALIPDISGPYGVDLEQIGQIWQAAECADATRCHDNCHPARAPPVA